MSKPLRAIKDTKVLVLLAVLCAFRVGLFDGWLTYRECDPVM